MSDQIRQLEEEVQRSQSQSDLAREAEQRMRETQDLPKYQYNTDGSMERHFADKQGRDTTLRVEGADQASIGKFEQDPRLEKSHQFRVRAFDTAVANEGEPFKDKGRVAHAEASLESSQSLGSEETKRMRLTDIETLQGYRGNGIGDQMLGEVEQLANEHGAKEVYGVYSPEAGTEARTRAFYEAHGYQFRPGASGGTEVYKRMGGPASDAQMLKQEAMYRS